MARQRNVSFRPELQVLEDRCLPSGGLTIVRNFVSPGEALPRFGPAEAAPAANTAGAGNLADVFHAAADWWEAAIREEHTVTLHFGWFPLGGPFLAGSHRLVAQGGLPQRETEGAIAFDNDGSSPWFLDPTPRRSEEFSAYAESFADLGGGRINTGRGFTQASGAAAGRLDLFTIALHEVGHALGLSSANRAYRDETGVDNAINVKIPLRRAGTVIPTANPPGPGVFNAHLVVDTALLAGGAVPELGERRLIAAVDILANAEISDFKRIDLDPHPFKHHGKHSGHGRVVHRVIGSGTYDADLGFATIRSTETWAVFQTADGRVWGHGTVTIDFGALGLGTVTFTLKAESLEVDGKNAWIGGLVTHSTNKDLIAVGSTGISQIRDLGGQGEDYLNGSPSSDLPPGTTPHDRPAIPGDVTFLHGNFRVR